MSRIKKLKELEKRACTFLSQQPSYTCQMRSAPVVTRTRHVGSEPAHRQAMLVTMQPYHQHEKVGVARENAMRWIFFRIILALF